MQTPVDPFWRMRITINRKKKCALCIWTTALSLNALLWTSSQHVHKPIAEMEKAIRNNPHVRGLCRWKTTSTGIMECINYIWLRPYLHLDWIFAEDEVNFEEHAEVPESMRKVLNQSIFENVCKPDEYLYKHLTVQQRSINPSHLWIYTIIKEYVCRWAIVYMPMLWFSHMFWPHHVTTSTTQHITHISPKERPRTKPFSLALNIVSAAATEFVCVLDSGINGNLCIERGCAHPTAPNRITNHFNLSSRPIYAR